MQKFLWAHIMNKEGMEKQEEPVAWVKARLKRGTAAQKEANINVMQS